MNSRKRSVGLAMTLVLLGATASCVSLTPREMALTIAKPPPPPPPPPATSELTE